MITTVNDVLLFSLREYNDNGLLVPITSKIDVPFNIKRLFYVDKVSDAGSRGNHAHIKCNQVLIPLRDSISINCFDGTDYRSIILDKSNMAVYIPTGIWSEEVYTMNTLLLVLCDHIYDPREYIKDLKEFKEWKKKQK